MTHPAPPHAVALLVRHGHTDAVGHRLVGRLPGVALSACGRVQAERLRHRLAAMPLAAVYSSPLERAMETARPLAADHGLHVTRADGLAECDFGDWTGATFADLEQLASWRRFNTHRSLAEVPGGETALDVQRRIVRTLDTLRRSHAGETIVLVTHQDVIRAALLHCAGASLDFYDRFVIAPGSITTLELNDAGWRIAASNTSAEEVLPLSHS